MINRSAEIISNFIKQYLEAVTEEPENAKIEISQKTHRTGVMMTIFTVWGLSRHDASLVIGFSGYNIEALRLLVERIGIRQNLGMVRVNIVDPDGKYGLRGRPPRFLEKKVRREGR